MFDNSAAQQKRVQQQQILETSDISASIMLQQLREFAGKNPQLPFTPPVKETPANLPLRRSAVLLLFSCLPQAAEKTRANNANQSGATNCGTEPQLNILLTQRALTMRHHAGQIAFPGGGIEPTDADAVAAALRETHEETGITSTQIEVFGTLKDIHVPVSNNLITPVLANITAPPQKFILDPKETAAASWVPINHLLDPQNRLTGVYGQKPRIFKGPAFKMPAANMPLLWGFTGIVLSSLFTELSWSREWDSSITAAVH